MKRKSITILYTALIFVLLLTFLTACTKNKHEFSDEWKFDESSHWHECLTEKHTDISGKNNHNFDEGKIVTAPTEQKEGIRVYTCKECGYEKNESIEKLEHEHKYDVTKWKFDDENHWHPAICEHSEEQGSVEKHSFDTGIITKNPTETVEGEKTYTCITCKKTKIESIGTLDHTHKYDTEKWESDSLNHWHPATCEHKDEKKDFGAHSWNDGIITTPATEETEGVKTFTCTVCKKNKTEIIPVLGHTHKYFSEWSNDATYHWHAASCKHTDERKDVQLHTFSDWNVVKSPTYTEKGEEKRTCDICKYIDIRELDKLEAKENSLVLVEGIKESEFYKEYDKEGILLTKEMFVYNGNGELSFEFKKDGETEYTKVSPTTAGEYIVKVTVSSTPEWKEISKEYNYSIDKKKVSIEDKIYYANYIGKDWKVSIILNEENGILEGDNVLIELLKDNVNDWTDGSSFEIYTEDANKANDRERVKITGKDAINYELEPFDSDGKLMATLECTVQETKVDGSCYSESLWGSFPVKNLKCGYSNFMIGGEEGSFAEKLFQGENAYKKIIIKVNAVIGTETICIAVGTRFGLDTNEFDYIYEDMTFISNSDSSKNAFAIDLIKNVEGLTDEDGKWIYEESEITLKLMINASDYETVPSEEKLYEGKLVNNAYIIMKFISSEGIWTLNFDSITIVSYIGVYIVTEEGLSENQWDSNHEFYTSSDEVLYIVIKVMNGVTGGVTINNMGL